MDVRDTLTGARGIVDLWYYLYEAPDPPGRWLTEQASVMTADEQERYRRLRFERDRRMFLATRALVRNVLTRYVATVPPEAWRFAAGPHGKPRIVEPIEPSVHFNLSNTRGLVVCAVSIAHATLGVDTEAFDDGFAADDVAAAHFSPEELRAFRGASVSQRTARFFAYWTLKESYIKARGLGLSLPLDQFWFHIGDEGIDIRFDPRLGEDSSRWRFALVETPPGHVVALGVDTGGEPLRLRARAFTP